MNREGTYVADSEMRTVLRCGTDTLSSNIRKHTSYYQSESSSERQPIFQSANIEAKPNTREPADRVFECNESDTLVVEGCPPGHTRLQFPQESFLCILDQISASNILNVSAFFASSLPFSSAYLHYQQSSSALRLVNPQACGTSHHAAQIAGKSATSFDP